MFFVWELDGFPCIGVSDSVLFGGIGGKNLTLDDGSEELYRYIPRTSGLRTAMYDKSNIFNYIKFSIFLPKGGGIWIEGPPAWVITSHVNIGYKFYSGGEPILYRIGKTGKFEIFIRESN